MISKKSIKIKIVKVFVPILLGGMFYLYFSPNSYITKFMVSNLGISIGIDINKNNNCVLTFIRNYGLDMLWSYSLSCAIMWIIGKKKYSFILASILAAGMELLQLFSPMFGTFDMLDILFECCSIFIAVFFWNTNYKK